MNTHTNKTQEFKSQSAASAIVQQQRDSSSGIHLEDNRSETITQRKLQHLGSSPLQMKQAPLLHTMATTAPASNNSNGVIQRFGFLGSLAVGALGLGAYGLYRWWNSGNAGQQENQQDDDYNGYFGLDGYDSEDDSDYEYDSEDDWDDTAEDRLARMRQRGLARRGRGRIPTGRHQTPTGMVTMSGLFGQRMTQSRRGDYGGETFGSVPPYARLQGNIPNNALPNLRDPQAPVPRGLSNRQRLGTSLAFSLAHGSEEDRAPGTSAYFRAMTGDYIRRGYEGDHPLSIESFPARSTAQEQRDLMEGRTPLTERQRRALEDDSEPSSDEDDDYFLFRQ